MKKTIILAFISALATLVGTGCACSKAGSGRETHGMSAGGHADAWRSIHELVAIIHPTQGNSCSGTVTFTETGGKVKVVADLIGLSPNQKHGFHIHEFGDCSAPDGTSAGGHYNPEGNPHALPPEPVRHAGDLGNVQADSSGKAHYEITVDNITLAGLRNPIIGHGVIVHAKADDGGQPTGNAGARIGCGVIGVAKSGS